LKILWLWKTLMGEKRWGYVAFVPVFSRGEPNAS
jgi:hypothetical protein